MNQDEAIARLSDQSFLDGLFGYAYRRCRTAHEAEDLCSEIVLEILKAVKKTGEIGSFYPFAWTVARRVWADCAQRRKADSVAGIEYSDGFTGGGENPIGEYLEREGDLRDFQRILREISFLSRAYREAMILYYLDGMGIGEISKKLGISETAVKQRLFSARNTVKKEVQKMEKNSSRPTAFQEINYTIWGTGSPGWGDPRGTGTRQLSKHVLWLCRNRPAGAKEISERLNVPMPYTEEELELLAWGKNGKYGLLKKLENGKYINNFILLDGQEMEQAWEVYKKRLPAIGEGISEYIETHREEYLRFPYINREVTFNLVLWQQISDIADRVKHKVDSILEGKYFADAARPKRPFSVFGYRKFGVPNYGGGWDGVSAYNICGYSYVHLDNIYITRIKKHFDCGLNVATEPIAQLAIRAIHGLSVSDLAGDETEQAAKAIEQGLLFREGEMLYTKFLVLEKKDGERLFSQNGGLDGQLSREAENIAAELAGLIRRYLPEHLTGEYQFFNTLAAMPVLDTVVEYLIERGLLIPPENGVGPEGIWMTVEK